MPHWLNQTWAFRSSGSVHFVQWMILKFLLLTHKHTKGECLCLTQQKTSCYVSTAILITLALRINQINQTKLNTVNWIQLQKSWWWVVYKWSEKNSSLWFLNPKHMVLLRQTVYFPSYTLNFWEKQGYYQ